MLTENRWARPAIHNVPVTEIAWNKWRSNVSVLWSTTCSSHVTLKNGWIPAYANKLSVLTQASNSNDVCVMTYNSLCCICLYVCVLASKQKTAAQWWWWGEWPPGAPSQKAKQRSSSLSWARPGCLGLWGTKLSTLNPEENVTAVKIVILDKHFPQFWH